jgi:multidrug efflux pump subunit AcrB
MQDGSSRAYLRDVATVRERTIPGEVDHDKSQRAIHVVANIAGSDLGRAASAVEHAIAALGAPPKGSTVAMHGQAEQMRATLQSLYEGLALTILVVLLMLAANFQSLREPLVVLSATPAVLAGVVVSLWISHTTINVQSLMGAIMSIGVSVANAILLVTFAKDQWHAGHSQADSIVASARRRLRPILMTSIAMVAGMLPTALALDEGGAQSASLGRAVIGGLIASTFATLVFLPAVYVIVGRRGEAHAPSLHPDDAAEVAQGEAFA